MAKSYIISVLDYFSGSIDIFQVNMPDIVEDIDIYIGDVIEDRGHHLSDCHYMYSEQNVFKLKIDI